VLVAVALVLAVAGCEERTVPLCEPWSQLPLPRAHKLVECWSQRAIVNYPADSDEELRELVALPLVRAGFVSGKRLDTGADLVMRRERDHLQIEITAKNSIVDLRRRTYSDWEIE
jgi:hypothetical protein